MATHARTQHAEIQTTLWEGEAGPLVLQDPLDMPMDDLVAEVFSAEDEEALLIATLLE